MTTGKIIALNIWIVVGNMTSLLSNMLSRFVIAFLPKRKRLLISWRQPLSVAILEPKKIKSVTVSTFSSSICHEVTVIVQKLHLTSTSHSAIGVILSDFHEPSTGPP